MSNKVVGKDVQISDVIKTMESASFPPSLAALMDKWSSIAMSLETSRELVKTLRQRKMMVNDFQTRDLAYELLDEWHRRVGDGATIEQLNLVFEQNGLTNYRGKEALTNKFITSPQPNTTTSTLSTFEFERQRAHIKKHLHELIGMTNLYADITTHLYAAGHLGDGDMAQLDCLPNRLEKNREFYQILQNKPGSYDVLIKAMEEGTQTGVADLLRRWNL